MEKFHNRTTKQLKSAAGVNWRIKIEDSRDSVRQHTHTEGSVRQHTHTEGSVRQHTHTEGSVRQHTHTEGRGLEEGKRGYLKRDSFSVCEQEALECFQISLYAFHWLLVVAKESFG
jgi:hypothetical protein